MSKTSLLISGDVDPKLKIFRKEVLDQNLQKVMDHSISIQQPIALLMLDVDHFKKFNDVHGHQIGDAVLEAVADKIRSVVGERGHIFRFGGEEITVVLPNYEQSEAGAIAERMRSSIQQLRVGADRLQVTISIGATATASALPAADLIHQADMALLRAKQLGRNRVELHQSSQIASHEHRPRIRPSAFNPYSESERLIEMLASGLSARCQPLRSDGLDAHVSKRGAKTCLRILLQGETRYSLDMWIGGFGSDHGISLYGVPGEIRGGENATNATAEMVWDKETGSIAVELMNFSLLRGIGDKKKFKQEDFLEELWRVIVKAVERD